MANNKIFFLIFLLICLLIIVTGCSSKKESKGEKLIANNKILEIDDEEILVNETDEKNVESIMVDLEHMEDSEREEDRGISLFSWSFELTNQECFYPLSEVLIDYNVDRIYQAISARNIREPEMALMIQKLSQLGIETVALTGDKSWVDDGLREYEKIIDQIDEYNYKVSEVNKIKSIALDVEFHRLPEWEENKEKVFERYIEVMKEAKEYANSKDLRVIQIIPTMYDDIDHGLFKTFVKKCCDELSIMNYFKENIQEAIEYEVYVCDKYGIPIETIFETMPLSKEHGVTEEITYFYSGIEALEHDIEILQELYGNGLGIAIHHITTFHEMVTGEKIGEIYGEFIVEENQNPGYLLLYGEDGSMKLATPHWPNLRKGREDFCWLVFGVKEEEIYQIEYCDFYNNYQIMQDATFTLKDDSILEMRID